MLLSLGTKCLRDLSVSPWDECRNANVLTLRQLYPEHTVLTVNTAEPVVEELVALDTVGVVAAEDSHQPDLLAERSQRFVSHNQKDDYVHRGKAAVLQAMSLVLYSRFVVRRKKEQKVIDYFRYFPFDSHYEMHHAGFIQEIRIGDNNVVVPMQLRLPSEQEQPEKHYSTLLLLCNAFDGCASSAQCADTKPCFSCHDVTFDHKQKKIFVVFRSRWRRVYARMKNVGNEGIAEIYEQLERQRCAGCCWHEMVVSEGSFQFGRRRDERESATSRWGCCRILVVDVVSGANDAQIEGKATR